MIAPFGVACGVLLFAALDPAADWPTGRAAAFRKGGDIMRYWYDENGNKVYGTKPKTNKPTK